MTQHASSCWEALNSKIRLVVAATGTERGERNFRSQGLTLRLGLRGIGTGIAEGGKSSEFLYLGPSPRGSDPVSKRVTIFPGTQEALIKMVPINRVPISRSRTVDLKRVFFCSGLGLVRPDRLPPQPPKHPDRTIR